MLYRQKRIVIVAVLGILVVAIVAVLVVSGRHKAVPNSATPISTTTITQTNSAKGRHGGAERQATLLPPDWPADVQLPSGTVLSSNGASPSWNVTIVVSGSYTDAMKQVGDFYRKLGYTEPQSSGPIPYQLTKAPYEIKVVGENRDHSNAETNVVIHLSRQ
jgi:ABC-type molybdate transport system substrate-binding protein